MKRLNFIDYLFLLLLLISAVHWGLWGLFEYNIYEEIFSFSIRGLRMIRSVEAIIGLYVVGMVFLKSRRADKLKV